MNRLFKRINLLLIIGITLLSYSCQKIEIETLIIEQDSENEEENSDQDESIEYELVLQPNSEMGKDATISYRYQSKNMGESPDFAPLAWTNGGIIDIYRSLIQFDLTEIPEGAEVESAILALYNNPTSSNTNGEHSPLTGSNECILLRITEEWDEYTLTWENQPAVDYSTQVVLNQSLDAHQDYEIDITEYAQYFVTNPSENNGLLLRLQTEEIYRSMIFASSDNLDSSIHPKLTIVYSY